jgi:photosystem II stability/assembly factor-like uncharacterized protein
MRYLSFLLVAFSFLFSACRDGVNTNGPVGTMDILWEQTNGPNGVWISSEAVANNGTLYISGDYGVYVSKDNGDSWYQSGLRDKEIKNLFIGSNSEVIGTTDKAIYISSDEGNNWIEKAIPSNISQIMGVISYKNGNIFLLVYKYEILYSADNGNSWQECSVPVKYYTSQYGQNSKGTIFIGTGSQGVLYSEDYCKSWKQLDTNKTGKSITKLIIDENDNLYLYSYIYNLAKSTDNGVNWHILGKNVIGNSISFIYKQKNDFLAVGSGTKIYITTDEKSWNTVDFKELYPSSIKINKDNVMFVKTSYGGLLRSKDYGLNWEETNKELLNATVSSIWIDKFDNIYALANGNKLYYSVINRFVWSEIPGPFSGYFKGLTYVNKNNIIFTSSDTPGIWKSSDNGNSWSEIPNSITHSINYPVLFKEDTRGNLYILSNKGTVAYSFGGFENWNMLNLPCESVQTIEINGKDNIFVIEGSRDMYGLENKGENTVYISTNYGVSWISVEKNIPKDLGVHSASDSKGNFYFSMGRYLCKVKGSENKWKCGIVLNTEIDYNEIKIDNKDNIYVLGNNNCIYISSDEGYTWRKNVNKLNQMNIYSLCPDSKGYIYLGTSNHSVMRGLYIPQNP